MTDKEEHKQDFGTRHVEKPMKQFLVDELVKGSIRWLIVALLAAVAYLATPLGSRVIAIWNSPIVLEQILFELASNRRVVDWSPATQMTGDCKRGEHCTLVARFRRVDKAAECQIIPEATRFTFMSYEDFIPRSATASGHRGYNIGTDFETREIKLFVPTSIPLGEGELRVSSSYRECNWQIGGEPPTSAVSPAIRVNIVK